MLQFARMREREKVTRRSLKKDIGKKRRKQKALSNEYQKDDETTVTGQDSMLLEGCSSRLEFYSGAVLLKEPPSEPSFYKKRENIQNTLLAENI